MADLTSLKDFSSITSVYAAMHKDVVSQGLIGVATFIAAIVVLKKFYNSYKEAFSDEKPANLKHFFNQFHIYIYTLALVLGTAPMFTIVEKGLSQMQDEYIAKYSGDVDMAVDDAVKQYEENYMKEELKDQDKNILTVALASWWEGKQEWFYTTLLYATKYIFYFFAAGRYLYLLLLEIVAPLAIVSFMDDSLKQYGITYLKHLTVCYLMIPAFLMANKMGVELGQYFIESLNSYSIMALLCGFIFKLGLLKKAQNYVEKLL